jgi:predicted SnoaL-like aldol condensation-catalyzing enzyme
MTMKHPPLLRRILLAVLAIGLTAGLAGAAEPRTPTTNKEIVLQAMIQIFQKRDLSAIDKFWDKKDYIQHNPAIPNGHEALRAIIAGLGPEFKYEPGLVIGEGDIVMIHGRYLGWGPKPMIAVDIFRLKEGKLIEHWDVLQEEVPASDTKSGNAMFTNPQK